MGRKNTAKRDKGVKARGAAKPKGMAAVGHIRHQGTRSFRKSRSAPPAPADLAPLPRPNDPYRRWN